MSLALPLRMRGILSGKAGKAWHGIYIMELALLLFSHVQINSHHFLAGVKFFKLRHGKKE
jgi:hypothetical protein